MSCLKLTLCSAALALAFALPAHAGIVEEFGVEVLPVRLSAAGYMLDFRFRVVDPNKAGALMDRRNQPMLIDETSGERLAVPMAEKVGSLRQVSAKPIPGQVFGTLFGNPGRMLRPGAKVTIEIGPFRVEHMTVEG